MNHWFIYLNLILPILCQLILIVTYLFFSKETYGLFLYLIDWVVVPFGLALINVILFFTKIEKSFLKVWLFMLGGLLLSFVIGYIAWGILTGKLFHPDGETIHVTKWLLIYYVCFVGIFFLIIKGGQLFFKEIREIRGHDT